MPDKEEMAGAWLEGCLRQSLLVLSGVAIVSMVFGCASLDGGAPTPATSSQAGQSNQPSGKFAPDVLPPVGRECLKQQEHGIEAVARRLISPSCTAQVQGPTPLDLAQLTFSAGFMAFDGENVAEAWGRADGAVFFSTGPAETKTPRAEGGDRPPTAGGEPAAALNPGMQRAVEMMQEAEVVRVIVLEQMALNTCIDMPQADTLFTVGLLCHLTSLHHYQAAYEAGFSKNCPASTSLANCAATASRAYKTFYQETERLFKEMLQDPGRNHPANPAGARLPSEAALKSRRTLVASGR